MRIQAVCLTSLPFVSPFSNHSTEMLLVSGFILDTTALWMRPEIKKKKNVKFTLI